MKQEKLSWKEISDKEFIELSKNHSSKTSFAKSFGLKRDTISFNKRIISLNITFVRKNKFSKETLTKAVMNAASITEVIINLGEDPNQNYRYREVKYYAQKYNIELPVFNHQKANKNSSFRNKLSDDEFFSTPSNRNGSSLTKRMIEQGIPYNCSNEECMFHTGELLWTGKPFKLEVDHINGQHYDNRLENLRFLCSLCHQLTDTYAGKNKSKKVYYCAEDNCNQEIGKNATRCNSCAQKNNYKGDRPSRDELLEVLDQYDWVFTHVSEYYSVSDNSVRKWCKYHDLPFMLKDIKEYRAGDL